jgi:multiple sugar transport system substrate-binding protein
MGEEKKEEKAISRRKYLGAVGGLAAATAVGWGLAGYLASRPPAPAAVRTVTETKTVTATPAVTTPTPGVTVTTPTPKKPFEGVTLKVYGMAGPFFYNAGTPPIYHEWEEKTGGKVELILVPYADFLAKFISTLQAGGPSWDVACYNTMTLGDVWEYLTPLDDFINDPVKSGPTASSGPLEYDDILPVSKKVNTWAGTTYGLAMDGDALTLYYRTDLLGNEDYRNEFKKKFGYDMPSPDVGPRTWDEYTDVGIFFNGWDWNNDGKPEAGIIRNLKRAMQAVHQYLGIVYSYAQMPGGPDKYRGHIFFDPDTMEPLVNTPGWVKAMEILQKQFMKAESPSDIEVGFEYFDLYPKGVACLTTGPANIGVNELTEGKGITYGNVGHNILPGAKEVWDRENNRWTVVETLDPIPEPGERKKINFAPYAFCGGGWANSIPKTSKYKDAAWDFCKWISEPSMSLRLNLPMGPEKVQSGVNPFRYSHLKWEPWEKAGFKDPKFVAAQGLTLAHENTGYDLRIPGTVEYYDVIEVHMSKVCLGKEEPSEACDAIYHEWKEITDRRGLEKQKKSYRMALGLPV